MTHWNKVSTASSYPVHVRSNVDEGPERVWFVRSIGSLQILAAVGVLIKGRSQLASFRGDFDLFFWFVLLQDLTSPILSFPRVFKSSTGNGLSKEEDD